MIELSVTVFLVHPLDLPDEHPILDDVEVELIQMRDRRQLRARKLAERVEVQTIDGPKHDISHDPNRDQGEQRVV